MYGTIQLVMCTDEGREDTVTDVRPLTQDCQRLEHLGSARAAAKPLLTLLQPPLLAQPIDAWLAAHSGGETCGSAFKVKGDPTCTFRTLFSTFTLARPRLVHCHGQRRQTTACRPLTA